MDFSWFATIPGMLITGGVLLLIISLVMFIAMSNKKDKAKSNSSKKSEDGAKNIVNEMQQNVPTPVDNTVNNSNIIDPMTVSGGLNASTSPLDASQNVSGNMTDISAMPVGDASNMQVSDVSAPSFDVPLTDVAQQTMPQNNDFMNSPMPVASDVASSTNVGDVTAPVTPEVSIPVMPEVSVSTVDNTTSTAAVNSIPVVEAASVQNVPEVTSPTSVTPVMPEVSTVSNAFDVSNQANNQINNQVGNDEINSHVDTNSAVPVMPEVTSAPSVVDLSNVVNSSDALTNQTPVTSTVAPVVDVNSQPSVPIYGGASPVVSNVDLGQESHQIYGGANPLDNTQNISIADINQAAANAMAHNAATATPTVTSVPNVEPAPTVEVVPVAPVTPTPVQTSPAVQPVVPVTPDVVTTPNVVSTPNQGQ